MDLLIGIFLVFIMPFIAERVIWGKGGRYKKYKNYKKGDDPALDFRDKVVLYLVIFLAVFTLLTYIWIKLRDLFF